MKIAVISDTHISDNDKEIPPQVLDEFKKVDMIIHAGDLIDLSLLTKLKHFCPQVKAVWGNMDPAEVRDKLPQKELIRVEGLLIGVIHGYGRPDNLINLVGEAFKQDKADIIIFGHSHSPVNIEKDGTLYFNPGSLTDKIFASCNSYGIIEINDSVRARIIKI